MNPKNIITLLQKKFNGPEYDLQTIITDEEKSFALQLEELIKNSINTTMFVETYESLSFNEPSVYPYAVIVDEELNENFEVFENENKKVKLDVDIDSDYKKRAVEFWRDGKKKRRSLEAVQNRFKRVVSVQCLYRWEEQMKAGGTRTEKLLQISQYVLEYFKNASDKSVSVHDLDLKRWALEARAKFNLSRHLFTASAKWIHNFKVKHAIVSRKINKFITKKQIETKDEVIQKSRDYVSKVKSEMQTIGVENVFNSDQSGFNLETHAGRTLSFKGTLQVECLAQSLNSLTHSYTIQPFISASGELKSPLMIVLQEPQGKFGPNVENNMYKADNIVTFATKSGKLTSELAIKWYQDVYLPNTNEESILLLDSWTGQKETKFNDINIGEKSVKILTIPAGTTGLVQPLDVYTFRPWKNFLKQFSDIIISYDYDVNLHLRNNILKIQSLIHNQFSSPRFVNMFRYAWWRSGYINERPDKCLTPVEYCLKGCSTNCELCNDVAIIKCAWCTKSMCIDHFFAVSDNKFPHYCQQHVV